jgi:hypothetical protein
MGTCIVSVQLQVKFYVVRVFIVECDLSNIPQNH